MVELDGDHGDGDDHKTMIKCSTFRKEETEKQKWAQGKGITIRAIFVLVIVTPSFIKHNRMHITCMLGSVYSYVR